MDITLDTNVSLAPDMQVKLYQTEQSMISGESKLLIGQFNVPIDSITELYTLPQYFDFLDSEMNIVGKLLARFYLIPKSADKID